MSELKATTAQEIVRNEKDCDYMDELFGGVKMPPTQVYIKSEADKVIDELKADYQEACDRLQTANLIKDKQIVELKAKLEDAKATAYAESVDAGMENRRLKRALWLSRAERARSMKTYEDLDNYTRNHLNRNSRWNYISSQRYDCWFYAWDNVERKCLKKAEQYK